MKSHQVIENIRLLEVFNNPRQGDWFFFDIDDTLVRNINDEDELIDNDLAKEIKRLAESRNIKIFALTARPLQSNKHTLELFANLDIPIKIIINAPYNKNKCQKGKVLFNWLTEQNEKPKRIIFFDDLKEQLDSINEMRSSKHFQESDYAHIPFLLYQYAPKHHLKLNKQYYFPDTLENFHLEKQISKNKFLIKHEKNDQQLILNVDGNSDEIKMEILCNILYQQIGVIVAQTEAYIHLPKGLAKELNIPQTDIIQISEYKEDFNEPENKKQIVPDFIQHAYRDNASFYEIEKTLTEVSYLLDISSEARNNLLNQFSHHFVKLQRQYLTEDSQVSDLFAHSEQSKTSAGILTYAYKNGKCYVLISERDDGGWDNFGGKSEDDDDEDLLDTAIREVQEESNNILNYDKKTLLDSPFHDIVTKDGKVYRMYLCEHDWIEDVSNVKDHEHLQTHWLPLENLSLAIGKSEDNQETTNVKLNNEENITLFSPFYQMLRQKPIYENLMQLEQNKPLKKLHTINAINDNSNLVSKSKFTSASTKREQINRSVLNKGEVIKSINHQNEQREIWEYQMRKSFDIKPNTPKLLSPSELHMKVVLDKDYLENNIEKNVALFCETFFKDKFNPAQQKELCQLIEIEKEYMDDHVSLYHAVPSHIYFAYMVLSELNQLFRAKTNHSTFRLDESAFAKFPTIHEFINYFSDNNSQKIDDYAEGNADCSTSNNVFIFGCHKKPLSCSLNYLSGNFCCDSIDHNVILSEYLNSMNVDTVNIKKIQAFYETNSTLINSTMYQIRIPKMLISKISCTQSSGGPLNPYFDTTDISKILDGFQKKNIEGTINSEDIKYIKEVEVRMLFNPKQKIHTEKMHYKNTNLPKEKMLELKSLLKSIAYVTLSNRNQRSNLILNSSALFQNQQHAFNHNYISFKNYLGIETIYSFRKMIRKQEWSQVGKTILRYPEFLAQFDLVNIKDYRTDWLWSYLGNIVDNCSETEITITLNQFKNYLLEFNGDENIFYIYKYYFRAARTFDEVKDILQKVMDTYFPSHRDKHSIEEVLFKNDCFKRIKELTEKNKIYEIIIKGVIMPDLNDKLISLIMETANENESDLETFAISLYKLLKDLDAETFIEKNQELLNQISKECFKDDFILLKNNFIINWTLKKLQTYYSDRLDPNNIIDAILLNFIHYTLPEAINAEYSGSKLCKTTVKENIAQLLIQIKKSFAKKNSNDNPFEAIIVLQYDFIEIIKKIPKQHFSFFNPSPKNNLCITIKNTCENLFNITKQSTSLLNDIENLDFIDTLLNEIIHHPIIHQTINIAKKDDCHFEASLALFVVYLEMIKKNFWDTRKSYINKTTLELENRAGLILNIIITGLNILAEHEKIISKMQIIVKELHQKASVYYRNNKNSSAESFHTLLKYLKTISHMDKNKDEHFKQIDFNNHFIDKLNFDSIDKKIFSCSEVYPEIAFFMDELKEVIYNNYEKDLTNLNTLLLNKFDKNYKLGF